ncbi:hypothetical protein BH11ACT8_BH11ACT8_32070 [soil metagenome]
MTTTHARRMLVTATVLGIALAVLLTFAPTGQAVAQGPGADERGAAAPATFATFRRDWYGHTRSLKVRRDHIARESVYSGCCERGADLKFRLSKPRGTTRHATIRAVLVKVRYWDRSLGGARPHRGDVVRFTLRRGVLTEPIVGTVYCNDAAGRRGACGA